MKLRISGLPEDVTEDDLRGLLSDSSDIQSIDLVKAGDSDNPEAVIQMSSSAAAEGAVELLNGRNWKGCVLRADKILY